jgi:poly(glycerol-phosphate) alpha-glucosyltransferase
VVSLPAGRQFALTWSVPDDFGGMTSALLHRSRAFVRLGGSPVDVLTFDARPDYPRVAEQLRQRGEFIDGMRLLNLWDWLRTNELRQDAPGSLDLDNHPFTPLAPDPAFVSSWGGGLDPRGEAEPRLAAELCRTRLASDGTTVLQVDYYREDGSLLASDRRDILEPDQLGGRSVVLCDQNGTPVRSWAGTWGLYRFWLDVLRNREPSFLLVDSKTVAAFATTYRRKRAVLVHIVHNSHLVGDDPLGELRESRRTVFENLTGYDGIVVLTERQRRDLEMRFGRVPNLTVIPNGRDLQPGLPSRARPAGRGIVMASLTSRKRVDHAVRAMIAARQVAPGDSLTLDIFGDGEERASLEQLVAGRPEIRLHGYRADAREHLAEASFILLTGRSEGFPLALVEAMAAGCIPIAYDVPYGPSDMIVNGRNGFLVPGGDEQALAAAILELQRMPWHRLSRMRRSARRAARRFSDAEVTRRWAVELRAAAQRKAEAWAAKSGGYPDSRSRAGVATLVP